jgi:hypothetical protein
MTTPPLRIAFAAVFWRIFLVAFATQQFTAFHKTRHLFRGASSWEKWLGFVDFTPYALVLGLLVAAMATVAADLAVRLLLRRAVARWYDPAGTGAGRTPLSFHLGAGEAALAEAPARRREGRGWRAGTLVLTDRRVAFYPVEWDLEPWDVDRDNLRSLRIQPARAMLGSFVEGVPGTLVLRDHDGRELALALARPDDVVHWFDRPDLAADAPPPGDARWPLVLAPHTRS